MKRKLDFEPKWFVVTLFFVAGFFIGGLVLFVWVFNGGHFYGIQKVHFNAGQYKYINPLLATDTSQSIFFDGNSTLDAKINREVMMAKRDGDISDASIYFRDLEPGDWVGINEDEKYSPGKILKLPIAIAYYLQAQTDPSILDKKLVYSTKLQPKDADLEQGGLYSIDDLITEMLQNDDSATTEVLFDNINTKSLDNVYSDLGYEIKENKTDDDYTTVKHSGLIYRILYNSTYLNREMSEKLLGILAQSGKDQGFAAGLPNDITVAHRYHIVPGQSEVDASDCGIVYFPGHPYELCMTIKARDEESAQTFFEGVSQIAYEAIKNKYH